MAQSVRDKREDSKRLLWGLCSGFNYFSQEQMNDLSINLKTL